MVSLRQQEEQLLQHFSTTFMESDRAKREAAIQVIKGLEVDEYFLQTLFKVIFNYSYRNYRIEVIQAILNWIEKYIEQQYNKKYDVTKKISRIKLFEMTISGIDSILKINTIPHKIMLLLSKPLAMMLNHEFNSTFKLELIQSFSDLTKDNPSLLFFELYSLLIKKQHQSVLTTIFTHFNNLINNLIHSKQNQTPFYFQVIYMFLKQIIVDVNMYQEIVGNRSFMQIILKSIQTGKKQLSQYPLEILTMLTELKDRFQLENTLFLNEINNATFPMIYDFLIKIPKNLIRKQEREQNQKFVLVLIKYFNQLIKINKNQQELHNKKQDILLNIILPLLLIPKQQAQQMLKQSPEKYIKIKQDMTNTRKMQQIVSVASQLLSTYCDKVPGITTLVTEISLEIIRNQINSKQFIIKKQYLQSTFFVLTNNSTRIQIALGVFCILSSNLQQRKDFIIQMQDIIQKYLTVLFDPWKTEVSVMFVIFLQYFIDSLFFCQDRKYLKSFVFDAILVATSIHPSRALLLIIYEFIQNILLTQEYQQLIKLKTLKLGQSIMQNIIIQQDIDSLHIFKQLLEIESQNIVTNYNSQFVVWLQKLTSKLKQFIDHNEFNQFVVKGLDLLDSLMMNEEYQCFLDSIYHSISHYMIAFKNSNSHIYDQILTVVNRYIEITKTIPESINILLEDIEQHLKNNQSNLYNIFRTLCFVIIYSKQEKQIERVYSLGLLSLKQTTTKLTSIVNPLEGVLLVHLSIFHHINKFSFQYLQSLIEQTLNILSYQYMKHQKAMYGKYLLVILQCLRFRFEQTTQIIKSKGQQSYQNLYKLVFQAPIYYDGYDRKLLVSSLITMIYHKEFEINFVYPAIRCLIQVLFNQYNAIKLNSIELYMDSSSDSEKQDQQQLEQNKELTQNQPAKQIFKLFPNPQAGIDEYAVFRQLVEKMKMHENSLVVFEKVVDQLPIGLKKFLTDYALRMQKVEGQQMIENRKIFKVKRNK